MVSTPWPPVMDRRSGAYRSTSFMGTWALISVTPSVESEPRTLPRRLERSPMTSPMFSSGMETVSWTMGSSRMGLHFSMAFLKAREPATLKAISDESTVW